MPVLHSRHPRGTLELELGDWMDNRRCVAADVFSSSCVSMLVLLSRCFCRFRVVAFDHDLLSFSDLQFEQWPAVLVTNPKDAQYVHPGVEPLGRIQMSTHIRSAQFLCSWRLNTFRHFSVCEI